jgi:hypothetical protein
LIVEHVVSKAGAVRPVLQSTEGPATGCADDTSVRTDAGQMVGDQQVPEPTNCGYTPEERTAIDRANEAFAPVIKAIETVEAIEVWVPPLVRGVRALRDRATRETGALNYLDQEYRTRFGDLLNAEPIGSWLLDERRSSLRDAIHYLGSDDTYLDSFLEWRATKISEQQREKWRTLRTLVDHFKAWQSGTVPSNDRRTSAQKEIERVRTEGHQADAARLAEVEQARRELATQTIESTETLRTVLRHAGPKKLVQAINDEGSDYAETVFELLATSLKKPTT